MAFKYSESCYTALTKTTKKTWGTTYTESADFELVAIVSDCKSLAIGKLTREVPTRAKAVSKPQPRTQITELDSHLASRLVHSVDNTDVRFAKAEFVVRNSSSEDMSQTTLI